MVFYSKKSSSILKKILLPMSLIVFVQIALLAGIIKYGGVTAQLSQNALDILNGEVRNRKSYLESEMLTRWANMPRFVHKVNNITQGLVDRGEISLEHISTDEASALALLEQLSPQLIALLRRNYVTGSFLILNDQDLAPDIAAGTYREKPGIYLRNLDFSADSLDENLSLLMERGPATLSHALGTSLDGGWLPSFQFNFYGAYYPFFSEPYQKAIENPQLPWNDLGYWSSPYQLYSGSPQAISYSVPLILDDGTLYGVLGVEINLEYLHSLLPFEELPSGQYSSYIFANGCTGKENLFHSIITSGYFDRKNGGLERFQVRELEDSGLEEPVLLLENAGSKNFYCDVQYFNLYPPESPFYGQQWALVGIALEEEMFAMSNQIVVALLVSIGILLVVGILGTIVVGYTIAAPIGSLVKSVEESHGHTAVALERTNLAEIDRLAQAIEALSGSIFHKASKFTNVLNMATVSIGIFELDFKNGEVFFTDGFLKFFLVEGKPCGGVSLEEFCRVMQSRSGYIQYRRRLEGNNYEATYRLPHQEGFVWRRLRISWEKGRCFGLVEDITDDALQMEEVIYQRDYDPLTNLLTRRAFYQQADHLFARGPACLKTAAMAMVDLDDLKFVNDHYGHECGDSYIRLTAQAIAGSLGENALAARFSGDEFYIFIYGRESEEEIRRELRQIQERLGAAYLPLPGGGKAKISASVGAAWYGRDSVNCRQLIQYADFAMYQVKRSEKGQSAEFDLGRYKASQRRFSPGGTQQSAFSLMPQGCGDGSI